MLARRRLLMALFLAACAGPVKPAAIPNLTELPSDPQEQAEVLDSANQRPAPETRKPLSPKARQVETAAATAAALIGFFLSSSPNVMIGVASPIDENLLIDPQHPKKKGRSPAADEDKPKGDQDASAGDAKPPENLVPWIRVRPEEAR
jgi:hypothetical protein